MTKLELQNQIQSLQRTIDRQKKEADLRSSEYVLISLPSPGGEGNIRMSHAPYTADVRKGKKCSWRAQVIPILFSMLRAHSMPLDSVSGVYPKFSTSFLDDGDCGGDRIVVPRHIAELMIDLVNAMGDYGADCYRKGVETSADVLKQLASGAISASEYEDRMTRERIMEAQSWRRHRINESK